MAEYSVGHFKTSDNLPPLVVAEVGANHDGNIEKALLMLEHIAATGAKLVKFQLYTTEELIADKDRTTRWGPVDNQTEETIGEMFDRISLTREAFKTLFKRARELQLEPFATPFSEDGVDFLLSLDISCFKIASSDVTHIPLLRYIAKSGKPIMLSLGKCTLAEADKAIACLMENNCGPLALLHCVASYPSPMNEMDLRVIPTLRKLYPECVIGFSDHSLGLTAPIAAIALGARIIEKHVTLDRNDKGPDHWFSLDMEDLSQLVINSNSTYEALGHPRIQVLPSEAGGKQRGTRSLIAARNLPAGTVITKSDLKIVRPGTGLAPEHLYDVEGMTLKQDILKNNVIKWEHFKEDI